MKVLVACESSRKVAMAFEAQGHQAMSCDLQPSDVPGWHYQGDVRDVLHEDWDLLISHPTCTFMTVSGLHWNKRRPERAFQTEEAIKFAVMLMEGQEVCHIPKRVMENPIGCLSTRYRKPNQIIQPYQFGDDGSKATCLWLHGVRPLRIDPAKRLAGRMVMWNGKLRERWANQTDSGQNNLPPSAERWKLRSVTYPGVANAMAKFWGEEEHFELEAA